MRIVVCSNAYPPHFIGGAELVAHQQAKALLALGHDVRIYTGDHMLDAPRHAARDDQWDGLMVRRVRLTHEDFNPNHVTFSHPAVEQDFAAFLERVRPDVVHFHNVSGLSLKIISLAKQAGARTVVTLHDYWGFCFKNTAMKSALDPCRDFERCAECLPRIEDGHGRRIPMRLRQDLFKVILGNDVDVFVSPSSYLARMYAAAGFDPARIHVVWNGIDVERFARVERRALPEVVRFSFFGYFGRHKGVHLLIEALAQLRDPSRARVNLVGEGEMRQFYGDIAQAKGCASLVRFWGKVPNDRIEAAYRETDVLVLPSLWPENQPVSIMEAMASGLPVIASDMGGNPELVQHGITGILCPAEDVQALASAMQAFIDAPEMIDLMGARGRERMHRVSYAQQARVLLRLYRSTPVERAAGPQPPIVAWVGERFPENSDTLPEAVEARVGVPIRFVHADWLTARDDRAVAMRWKPGGAEADAYSAELPGMEEVVTADVDEAVRSIAARLGS